MYVQLLLCFVIGFIWDSLNLHRLPNYFNCDWAYMKEDAMELSYKHVTKTESEMESRNKAEVQNLRSIYVRE
jgi:hypothetical protein